VVQNSLRVLIGLSGLFWLFMAVQFWLGPVAPAAQLGVQAINDLGFSTIRADFASFFAVGGIFAVAAALKNDGRLALVPLGLFGLALLGRLGTAAGQGLPSEVIPPIAVEAIASALYLAGWRFLGRPAR